MQAETLNSIQGPQRLETLRKFKDLTESVDTTQFQGPHRLETLRKFKDLTTLETLCKFKDLTE